MNQDEWQKALQVAGPAGALGLIVAVMRGVIDQQGGWRVWLSGLTAAMLVSVIVGLGLHDTDIPQYMQIAIVGLCAYVSRDILTGVVQLSGMMASSPFGFLKEIRDFLRGRGGQ